MEMYAELQKYPDFNPRRPYGRRRFAFETSDDELKISIHAAHMDGDLPDRTAP